MPPKTWRTASKSICARCGKGEATLSGEGVDALFDGAQMLEQVIGARRAGTAPPSIDAVVARIGRVVTDGGQSDARDLQRPRAPTAAPRQSRKPRWRCTFSPSADLVARGIRVDTVRKRLSSAGEISVRCRG